MHAEPAHQPICGDGVGTTRRCRQRTRRPGRPAGQPPSRSNAEPAPPNRRLVDPTPSHPADPPPSRPAVGRYRYSALPSRASRRDSFSPLTNPTHGLPECQWLGGASKALAGRATSTGARYFAAGESEFTQNLSDMININNINTPSVTFSQAGVGPRRTSSSHGTSSPHRTLRLRSGARLGRLMPVVAPNPSSLRNPVLMPWRAFTPTRPGCGVQTVSPHR
jgi:hypothetical protein